MNQSPPAIPEIDYKDLFEKMFNGFAYHQLITDEQGKGIDYIFLEVNKAFEDCTGLKRGDVLGKKVSEVIPEIEHEEARWVERYSKVALTGIEERFESYSQKLDRWFKVYAFSPKKNFFAVLIEDISKEKKENEKATLYASLLDRTSDLVTILTKEPSPKYIFANKAHETIFGHNPNYLIEKSFLDYVHPEDRDKMLSLFNIQNNTKKITYRYRNSSREYIVTESTIDIMDTHMFIISRDITSKAMFIERLQSEKNTTELYFNIVDSVIIVLNKDFIITKINKNGCKLLEVTEENIVGKNWLQEYIPPEEKENIKKIHKNIIGDNLTFEHFENYIVTKTGKRKLILWHNKVLTNKQGEPIGTLSSGEDVTAQRTTEREVAKNFDDIEKFNKLAIDRELKMVELKNEIKRLKEELKHSTSNLA